MNYLEALARPYLLQMFVEVKNVDGVMFIHIFYKNELKLKISVNELNDQLAKGKLVI
jgi:hypothetical protein